MNKQLEALRKTAAGQDPFLDDVETPTPPNPDGQAALAKANGSTGSTKKGKGPGRPKTGKVSVTMELEEFDRPENSPVPRFVVSGQGGRQGTKNLTISVPADLFELIQRESSNVNATYIALLKYAVETLDAKGKGLSIKFDRQAK